MKIDGPIAVNVLDDDLLNKRTLEINFTEDFQKMEAPIQVAEMKRYIQSLFQNAQSLGDEHADKPGVLLIMQISEELLPYLQQGELDLAETIAFEMSLGARSEVSFSLADLKHN